MAGMEVRALETNMAFTPVQRDYQQQVEAHAESVRRQVAAQKAILPEYLAAQQHTAVEVEDVISAREKAGGIIDIIV
ncbi:hypothetical protein HY491_00230 [Candidatus Woesearchaeota archaeon]|nr:hypothetical protein [Candidatus Woesearchaeota archaeon]